MKTRAGKVIAGAAALAFVVPVSSASAQELSEMAVKSFMDFAWSLTPQQFSKPDGTTVLIDKKKPDEVKVPVDVAREVIKAGRLSAHAQICDLRDEQKANHLSLMKREDAKKKWTPQQLVYISQLHLTTVMLLTGKIKLVEKQGDKEVVVEEEKDKDGNDKPAKAQTCTDEQRKKVTEMIVAYVKSGPQPKGPPPADGEPVPAAAAAGAAAAAAAANKKAAEGTTTGSTAAAAPAGAAPAAKAPAAAPAAPAPEKK